MPTNEEIEKKIQASLGEMEAALKESSPGIFELMETVGQAEAAVKQAEAYLNFLEPRPVFSTSDRSY